MIFIRLVNDQHIGIFSIRYFGIILADVIVQIKASEKLVLESSSFRV